MEATALNERVRCLLMHHRTNAGLSTAQMAQLLHLPEVRYRRIEGGAQRDIPIQFVNDFCAALHMPIHRFLLSGGTVHRDFAMLITEQWELVCFLHETQRQMQQLVDCLQQNGQVMPPKPKTLRSPPKRLRSRT